MSIPTEGTPAWAPPLATPVFPSRRRLAFSSSPTVLERRPDISQNSSLVSPWDSRVPRIHLPKATGSKFSSAFTAPSPPAPIGSYATAGRRCSPLRRPRPRRSTLCGDDQGCRLWSDQDILELGEACLPPRQARDRARTQSWSFRLVRD